MAICSNIESFILPFNQAEICSLTPSQYLVELEKAKNRAVFIMLSSCTAKNPGWGISQSDYDLDESGQIQIALELLTSAEFLKRRFGLYSKVSELGDYTSPSNEQLKYFSDDLETWKQLEGQLRQEAWDAAYPYICDDIKNGTVGPDVCFVRNYDWQTLEKEYHTEIYPQYQNGKPYINPDFWGGLYW